MRGARQDVGVDLPAALTWAALAVALVAGACQRGVTPEQDTVPAVTADAAPPDAVLLDVAEPTPDVAAVAGDLALVGGTVVGVGPRTVVVAGGNIAAVVAAGAPVAVATTADVTGKWLTPSFIDSHVHAIFRPATAGLAFGGLGAVVDHAAPTSIFATSFEVAGASGGKTTLEVVAAGPMVTPLKGYPTQSWGSGGYGVECADLAAAQAAVDDLQRQGARLIKVPVGAGPDFDAATLAGIKARAAAHGLLVSTHATSEAAAAQAAAARFDVLAHTPTEALSDATVQAWKEGAVVSTLVAFGAGAATRDNLRRLREAGTRVLYGTDYGNTSTAGIDGSELAQMAAAGMTAAEIIAAGTTTPAEVWGLPHLGAIAQGKRANILVLDADPLADIATLASPNQVLLGGVPLL